MRCLLLVLWSVCTLGLWAQDKRAMDRESKVKALLARGKVYKARVQCDAMLGAPGEPRFFVYRADANNRIGDHAAAERDARAALAAHVIEEEALLQLGIAEQGLGLADSAIARFTALLARAPSADVHHRLGLAHQGKQDVVRAASEFNAALAGATGALRARIERGIAECAAQRGDTATACAAFERALVIDPEDPVTFNSRGWYVYALNGRHARAIADYDRALKLNPNYSYAFNNRGWSRYKLGEREKALADIERARKRRPGNAYIYRNLGIIALESGDKAKACAHFQHALDLHFTGLYGEEVQRLMQAECADMKPPAPPQAPAPTRANAPGGTPPPVRSNAP
jgi:tetratricopeptide (TPR) repeat protein